MHDLDLTDDILQHTVNSFVNAVFNIRNLRALPIATVQSLTGIAEHLTRLARTIDIACEALSDATAGASINLLELVEQSSAIDTQLASLLFEENFNQSEGEMP